MVAHIEQCSLGVEGVWEHRALHWFHPGGEKGDYFPFSSSKWTQSCVDTDAWNKGTGAGPVLLPVRKLSSEKGFSGGEMGTDPGLSVLCFGCIFFFKEIACVPMSSLHNTSWKIISFMARWTFVYSRGIAKNTGMLRFLEKWDSPLNFFEWKPFERFLVISTLSYWRKIQSVLKNSSDKLSHISLAHLKFELLVGDLGTQAKTVHQEHSADPPSNIFLHVFLLSGK